MYTSEDARFDYEALHGEACTRHGNAHCTKCCIECGRPMPCARHEDEDDYWDAPMAPESDFEVAE